MKAMLILAALTLAAGREATKPRPRTPEAELLRRYGHSVCLATAYKGTPVGDDAERCADLYQQEGRATMAPYQAVRRAAEKLDPAKPSIVGRRNFAIVACLEFYDSQELKGVIQQALAKPGAFP